MVEEEGSPKTSFMRNVNLFSLTSTSPPFWQGKLTKTKKTFSFLAGLSFLLLLFVAPTNQLEAQCSWSGQGTTYYSGQPTRIGCGAYGATQSVGSGTYNYFYGYNGINYTVSTCTSPFDTQITVYDQNPAWTVRAYNDDNGAECTYNNGHVDFTASYTGNHIAIVNRYNCSQHDFTGQSASLKIRENYGSAPANPTGGGSVCASSKTLSRGGSVPTGYTWYWQNTSNGTNTGLGSGTSYNATSSGTYYVRTRSANGCWGNQSAGVAVTLNADPAGVSVANAGTQCGGSRTITASGGAGGTIYYQGTTSNGTSTASATSSVAVSSSGTYYFRSRSAAGCWGAQGSAAVTIDAVPAGVSVNGGTTTCGTNQTITATGGSGGTMYYQGTTSNGVSTGSATSSVSVGTSGTYYFRSRSPQGCWSAQGSTVVVVNSVPGDITSISGGGTFCGGSTTLTASGGSGGTIYFQGTNPSGTSTSSGGASVSVSTTGTFYFRSRSAQGCWGNAANTVAIFNSVPAAVSVSASATTQCGGSVTLTASGGSGGTIYYQGTTAGGTSTGIASTSQSVSTSGTYYFRSFSGNCWGPQGSVTITINAVPATTSVTGGGTYCTNGTQTLTASGGSGGTIYWQGTTSNGTSTATASSSQAVGSSGTYYFRSRSAQGCWGNQGSTTITINSVPAAVSVSGGGIGCNGAATLTASGGSGGTIYWQNTTSNGTSTATPASSRNVTSSGTYYFRSISAQGCPGTQGSAAVTIVSSITLSTGGGTTQSTCGNSNGTACISASGGSGGYTYAWSGGGSSACKSGVPSGNYSVTVTDGSGCTASGSVNVTDAGSPTSSITAQTNVSCFGGNNGAATVTIGGGTAPYNLAWSNGSLSFGVSAGTHSASSLSQGLISVTVTDANGCNSSASTTITQPTQLTASVGSITDVLCFGASTGAININVGGGTGTKTFAWTGGYSTEDISGRLAGGYSVTVTDANSCTVSTSGTIGQPAAPLSASSTVVPVSCFSGNNGSIDLTVSGGTTTYTYGWSNSASSQDISTLTSGSYTVTITDANSCTLTHNKTVTQPTTGVSISVGTVTNVGCYGTSTGSVTVSGSGGTAGYTYAINTGSYVASGTFSGLAAGNYTLRVQDANGCLNSTPVTITQPAAALTATILSVTNANCYGTSSGAVDLDVTGGTTAYGYAWSNSASSQDLSGIAAGSYDVTVTDANSCTATATANVSQATILSATNVVTDVSSCQGFSNGAITFTGSGGTGVYQFSIDGGSNYQTSNTFSGLAAGTYDAYIKDNGVPSCAVQLAAVVIAQPASLPAPTLPGGNTYNSCGLLVVNVTPQGSGATKAILYDGIPGSGGSVIDTNTAFLFNSLSTGTYTFYTTSYNPTIGCEGTAYASFSISVVNPVLVSGSITNVSCFGAGNGAVDITPSGGTPPYTYSWSNGASSQDLLGVGGASYNVVVTDAQGCFNIGSFKVIEYAPVTATLDFSMANGFAIRCFEDSTTSINVLTNGGDGNYSYIWNDGSTSGSRGDIYAGSFQVTVTDGQGCAVVKSTTVYQPPVLNVSLQTSYQCSGGGYSSATIQVITAGGVSPFEYKLNGANYQASNTFSNLYDGSVDTFYVRDANNCITISYNTVTLPIAGSAIGSCDFIYVAPGVEGGDVNNAGTPDCPTTLAQAMNLVSGTRTYVRMLGGTSQYFYSTPVELVDGVNIEGGYTRNANLDWVKSTSATTVINFDNAYLVPSPGLGIYAGITSTGKRNWVMSDATINVQLTGAIGTQDGNGRSVYGLLINSSSRNYTMSNLVINTGNASSGANGIQGSDGMNGVNGADGDPGQFIQDNTGGVGPFAVCCGGGDGGTGGNGGGTSAGIGAADPGPAQDGSISQCPPVGSPSLQGGGAGGSGGHGGRTSNTVPYAANSGGRGGGGGKITGCTYSANGGAVATNNSNGFTWYFYSQPQPSPAASGVGGVNGSNGGNATLVYTPGNTPNSAAFGNYAFVPGLGSDGGDGFGGSGGSGGGGTGSVIVDGRGGSPAFLNIVRGSGGGAGAGGGAGGDGGDGGGGGGAAFGVYISPNSTTGASLTSVIVNSLGSAGTGGTGALGGDGGTGGFGGQGGPAMSDTQLGVVLTSPAGNGGNGGVGGTGGRGQDGDNGSAIAIYYGGLTAPTQTPAGTNGTVTVSTIKACTNSIIPITKTSADNWTITGGAFMNDLTSTTSSYTAADDTAFIFYTTTGNKTISVGSTNYPGFIKVTGTRPVPVITSAPYADRCEGATIDLTTSTIGVQYRWTLSNVDSPSVILAVLTGPTITNLVTDDAGTYIIRLQVREECCGWSIPAYATAVISPLPSAVASLNGPATVCANQSGVTYSAPLAANAAANVNTTTGYQWQLPAGASATSAGGMDGFVSGGNINITVTFGTNSGDVIVTPSNACGDGPSTTKTVTIAPTPVITGISGGTAICTGSSEILSPVVTGAPSYTYLWSTGASTPTITVSPVVTTTYTVTVTNGSCSDVASKTITVTPLPAAAGPITGLSSVYYGQNSVGYSIATVANAASYSWTVPAGASITSGQGTNSIVVDFGTALSDNITVTPVNGACNGTAASKFVTISAAPFVWTGNTSTNWSIASNWSTNAVPTAANNVLIPTGRPNYPSSYSAAPVANDLVIESGASVSIEAGFDMDLGGNVYVNTGGTLNLSANAGPVAPKLSVAGNWVMNGTMTPNTSIVTFDGTAAQTLQGTSNFYTLNINNSAGVSVSTGMAYVNGGLELDLGTFTTNDHVTIQSNALRTGWVDNFSAGMNGNISGDIIMQRFFPTAAVSTAFHYISSPVNGAGVASQFSELGLYGPDGGQVLPVTNCDPNNVAGTSPYGTLFEWRENASFLYNCNQSGWFVRSAGTLTNGRGYAGIVRRNADFTLDVKGTANTGTVAYNNLDNTTVLGDGWHLVSNPYPSPIEWNVPGAGFIGAAHFWQSSGSYTGTYQPQLSGTGYNIPSMQGFFIQTTGAGPANFVLTNSDRRTGDATFNRQANWYDHILNVELVGNNFADRTTVYFGADCSDAWDNLYDAQKKESRAGQPTLYTRIANYPKLVGINGLPTDDSKVVSVPMGLLAGTAGAYTFTFNDMSTFGASALIFLEDTKTGAIQNMRANDTYTFTSTLSDDPERFIIHFYPPAAITTADGNCEGLDGAINVDLGVFNVGGTQLTWDSYELTDAAGTVISSNTNVNGAISMANLPAGNYGLNLGIQGFQTSEIIIVGAPDPVDAVYAAGFSQAYTQAILEFLNQSVNATDYSWSFGDGSTSNLNNPTHIYTQPGIYDVTLVANSDDCSDTYTSKVEVIEVAVGLQNTVDAKPLVNISSYQDVITLGFLNLKDPSVQVDIFDLSGRKIIETLTLETTQSTHQIKMSYIASGYYFVRVVGTNTYSDQKIFLTSDN